MCQLMTPQTFVRTFKLGPCSSSPVFSGGCTRTYSYVVALLISRPCRVVAAGITAGNRLEIISFGGKRKQEEVGIAN